jgi:hypothetical protein
MQTISPRNAGKRETPSEEVSELSSASLASAKGVLVAGFATPSTRMVQKKEPE